MRGLIIVIVAVQLLSQLGSSQACALTQNGSTTCVYGCANCNNGICLSCCPKYYAFANNCIPCLSGSCLSCTLTATEVCNTCITGYGVSVSSPAYCYLCTNNTDINCQATNNCANISTCLTCNLYSLNGASQCLVCSSNYRNCNACNNLVCLSCYSGYALNVSSGYKQCVACNFPMCAVCSSGPVCSKCIAGYYIVNTICYACTMPCTACISLTVCTACDTSLSLYYLLNSTCQPCNATLLGCLTCGNIMNFTCTYCLDGYYLDNLTCTLCVSPCLTCTTAACTTCVNDSYALDANSTCVSCSSSVPNCNICNSSFICISCIDSYYISSANTCLTCDSLFSDCLTCDKIKCYSCKNGSQIQSDFSCSSSDCTSHCLTCIGNKTTCKSCILGYYLNNITCLVCDTSCIACLNASYCLTCALDLEYNNGVCTACPVGQNFNPFSLLCEPCPANCGACQWWTGCSVCATYFELTATTGVNRCTDICGDAYDVDLPCDKALGIANDGCSDQCKVETDYICTTTAFVSQCSYNGNFAVSIASAQQSIFANNLKLGFKIHPYLYGMPTNADTQSYLQTIFDLSPLNTLANIDISVDEKSQIVTFSIDHAIDISTIDLALTINFAYLASPNTMFQYLSNVTFTQNVGNILTYGRLGDYQQSSNLQLSKMIYAWSAAIGICALCIMIFGTFGKELAGLDQAILCQNMFMLIMFYQGKLNLPLLSMSGLKYSTGLHFSDSLITLNQGQSYNIQLDFSSFLYNCNFNLVAYILPLVLSFVILLYKLRYKHLPAKRDLAQQTYQVIMGETILYLVIFNFSGMVSFAYLFYSYSQKVNNFYDNLTIFIAALFSIFALFNFFAKPEILGMFRSAFRTESEQRDSRPRQKWLIKYAAFISKRCCEQDLKSIYSTLTINFYLIYLIYLLLFVFVVTMVPFSHLPIILVMQVLMLVFIILFRPHFNILEKSRAILTWTISVIGTLAAFIHLETFMLPVIFLILLTLHMLISILIIIASLWQQLKRKCNDRSEVVKSMMKEGMVDLQKDALKELILRFQKIERHNYSIDQEVQKIQQGYKQDENVRTHSPQRMQKQKNVEKDKEKKEEIMDEQLVQFQEEIIQEEHEHFRFQKGLDFFQKYNGNIDNDLIKVQYPQID